MGGLAFAFLLMMLAGGDEDEPQRETERPPDDDDNDFTLTGMKIPEEGEPDVDWIPATPEVDDGMSDAEWLTGISGLVSEVPKQNSFYMVRPGTSAADIARALLVGAADTGANRVRLIKCMTRVPWNREKYASTGGQETWGDLYDLNDGTNLSAAWMPRHPSAMQALANRMNPVRGIDEAGGQVGTGGYYGLIWIPSFTATATALVCNGEQATQPGWFTQRLQG